MTDFCVNEKSSFVYETTLLDADGAVVTLTSLRLSLADQKTGRVINSRDRVDILNANGGTYDEGTGLIRMEFESDDAEILNPSQTREAHTATFEAVWDTGRFNWKETIKVSNLTEIS